jgi:hypothetical protein
MVLIVLGVFCVGVLCGVAFLLGLEFFVERSVEE